MDYEMAALKLTIRQVKCAKQSEEESGSPFSLYDIGFQRVWVQGVIVFSDPDDPSLFLLDDTTSTIHISLHLDFLKRQWTPGTYVMVVGSFFYTTPDLPIIKAHKIVDLNPYPYREPMWYLEVIEIYNMFYHHAAKSKE